MTPMAPARVVMVGPRGAGKTTVGRALAGRLRWPFADGDERIAARTGKPVGVFLAEAGEPAFRALEQEVTLELLAGPRPGVLALGGGAVLSAPVREALRAQDVLVVFLEAPIATLAERIRGDPDRPRLTGLALPDEIATLLRARRPLYESVAHLRLETGVENVDAVCAQIEAKIRVRS